MPYYVKRGEIPHKRHTQFRRSDGELYTEEVMGMEGFSGIQSLLYHHYLPPRVKQQRTFLTLQRTLLLSPFLLSPSPSPHLLLHPLLLLLLPLLRQPALRQRLLLL